MVPVFLIVEILAFDDFVVLSFVVIPILFAINLVLDDKDRIRVIKAVVNREGIDFLVVGCRVLF